ncbi:MAG: aminomethyltransferase family protein [Phycisphaerae bacterium]
MADPSEPLKTPLYDKHVAMEAKMADVAGWLMPLSYQGVLDEVREVRQRAGVFDACCMGRIRVRGDGALTLLERACTHDVAHQEDDTAIETLLLNERGGIIDLCRLVRLESFWVVVTSALNREKVLAHLQALAAELGGAAKVDDQTQKTGMVAVIGPAAGGILDKVLPERVSQLPPTAARLGSFMLANYIVMRAARAGLWELDVVLPNLFMGQAWRFITQKAGESSIRPAGMAALDVLRIEAGQCAYGHEINETIDPFTAGLGDLVAMNHDFVGADAVNPLSERTAARQRVGIILDPVGGLSQDQTIDQANSAERQASADAQADNDAGLPLGAVGSTIIPRQGAVVLRSDGTEAGVLTSGTFSPTLDRAIAMAYVASDAAVPDTRIVVLEGDARMPGKIAALPFVPVNS